MSLQAKTFLNLLAGGLAGLLAWVLTDLTGWFADINQPHYAVRGGLFGDPKFLLSGALFGMVLGVLLALVDTLGLTSSKQTQRSLVMGGVIGFAGGWIGLAFGQFGWSAILNLFHIDPESTNINPGQFLVLLVARSLGYTIIGGIIGAAQGIVSRSSAIARQGAFGGLLGGFLGGVSFQILSGLNAPASLSRLVALVAVGALAGFFVGVVQNLFKQAWIRVVLGRNEGKEYLISKPVTTIGRSELADIGLYGDPSIAPTHVALEALPAQNRHRLRAVMEAGKRGVEYAPPLVNGQPVTGEQWLADGDTIQIGQRTLLFHEKATRRGASVPSAAPPPPVPTGTASRYVGEELAAAPSSPAARPSLTTPDEVIAQMGAAPPADATVLSGPDFSGPGFNGPGFGGLGTRLICVQGPYTGQSFPLSHTPVTIGRAPNRTVALPADSSISRTHARITYADGRHLIADDGSSNGTFVNGQRVSDPRPLNSGDLIQVAETALRYE